MIKGVFFDVANTLLHKPDLFMKITNVLESHDIHVHILELQQIHKVLSECTTFPDKTTKSFYDHFNAELLYALGVIPTQRIIDEIFHACTYLAWKPYADTGVLGKIELPIGVISNWDNSLPDKLKKYFELDFKWVLASELEGMRKPNQDLYLSAIEKSGLLASEIIYVGDSIKLDIEPAQKLGIKAILIDRLGLYKYSSLLRIDKMDKILNFL